MNDQKQPGAKRDSQPTSQQASKELLEHPEQLQMALEKIADEETAALPPIQIPTGDSDAQSGNDSGSHSGSHAPRRPRRRGRFLAYGARPEVQKWFYTFMCMNIPIVGWIYLYRLAFGKKETDQREFAAAYLYYKLFFLLLAAVILVILLVIGLDLLDKTLAYMEML